MDKKVQMYKILKVVFATKAPKHEKNDAKGWQQQPVFFGTFVLWWLIYTPALEQGILIFIFRNGFN